MTDKKSKTAIEAKIEKSDEKLDSMTVLMLHYCAGLQHCLDQEEVERQKQAESSADVNSNGTENDGLLDSGGINQGSTADEVEHIEDPSCQELRLNCEEPQRTDDETADCATEPHGTQTNRAEQVSETKNLETTLKSSCNSGMINVSSA
jgi:hypothetical protein